MSRPDNERKKEIKQRYKQAGTPMGVLQIKNMVNGKLLIVSCFNLDGKINSHRFQLTRGVHRNPELQKDWNQYGPESFSFEVLDRLEPAEDPARDYAEELKTLEEMWLEKLRPYGDSGYNREKKK